MTSCVRDRFKGRAVPGMCPFSVLFMLHVGEVTQKWLSGKCFLPVRRVCGASGLSSCEPVLCPAPPYNTHTHTQTHGKTIRLGDGQREEEGGGGGTGGF